MFLFALACLAADPTFSLEGGFTIRRVAGPPLVRRPMHACFDDAGRLYVTEAAGVNLNAKGLEEKLPNSIVRLEDADGDGVFDRAVAFADKMTFPSGIVWRKGAVYATSYPALYRLEDRDGDGKADVRTQIAGKFGSIGNAADLHGPQLGPDGWLYFCDGRNGHDVTFASGERHVGKSAGVYRCRVDGSGLERIATGGMDNPVEVAFTDAGEPFAIANLVLNAPRHDAILFAADGAYYPYHQPVMHEFPHTGEPLPMTGDLGWVAVSGFLRVPPGAMGERAAGQYLTAEFNTHRLRRHVIERAGAGFRVETFDLLSTSAVDFHPTSFAVRPDGSVLVIDTGGWFFNGCPQSKAAKPEAHGGIWEIRRNDAPRVADPAGASIGWNRLSDKDLLALLGDARHAVRERAIDLLADRKAIPACLAAAKDPGASPQKRLGALWALVRAESPAAGAALESALALPDRDARIAALHGQGLFRRKEAAPAVASLLKDPDVAVKRMAAQTLGRLGVSGHTPALLAAAGDGEDRWLEHAAVYAAIRLGEIDALRAGLASANVDAKRAALLALDALPRAGLERAQVVGHLSAESSGLRKAALRAILRRPEWAAALTTDVRRMLLAPSLSEVDGEALAAILENLAGASALAPTIAAALHDPESRPERRTQILETMIADPVEPDPPTWVTAMGRMLVSGEEAQRSAAVQFFHSRPKAPFDAAAVRAIAADPSAGRPVRLAALRLLARSTPPTEGERNYALSSFTEHGGSDSNGDFGLARRAERLTAAELLATADLDSPAAATVVRALRAADREELPPLLRAALRSPAAEPSAVLAALGSNPATATLSASELETAFAHAAPAIRTAAV
ncbi:MAG TPA: PVC-type heme-binding CxxCH protein, partial [Planctomycetia bacterium]|nr:PVC-type heme-binding CxxCH protein [Planctomycetia bacterium]